MTTSFNRTREQLARMVLRKLAVAGSTDVSADMELVYEAVDLRLKEAHRLGIVWRKVPQAQTAFSVASSATASAGVSDILFPIKMTITNNSQDDPVRIIDVREYASIRDKSYGGVPTKAVWDRSSGFVFHPVPISSATVKLTYEKIADDTAAGTAIDADVACLRWYKDIVAFDLSDEFLKDEIKIRRWKADSLEAERNIRKLSVQQVDYAPVAVDGYDRPERGLKDYGWNR